MTDATAAGTAAHADDVLGHPRGLVTLFFTEMWERLSYYGMRALLVLFMTDQVMRGGMGLTDTTETAMCGHFVLAIPSAHAFFVGLLLVVLGTGLLKPNASAVVGELYAPGDPRRDSGFSIFYMGINVGGVMGPLICGTLAQSERFGWHYGFAAAGFGMLFGVVQFYFTRSYLGEAGLQMLQPDSWPEQAALAAAGAWEKLDALKQKLIGGRRP